MPARKKKRIRAPQKSAVDQTRPATPPKRDKGNDGKFLPGNTLGFAGRPEDATKGGNPCAGAQMRFRARLQRAAEMTAKGDQIAEFDAIAAKLMERARKGDEWAIKEVLSRLCGKHPPADEEPIAPPPPPQIGDVTINSQVNHISPSLPLGTQARMDRLIEIANQFLPGGDKIIETKE